MECGAQFHSCRCCLLSGHEGHMPHVCRCGGAWDEAGKAVRWAKPEYAARKPALKRLPMPVPGAAWRFNEKTVRFERTDDAA